ncbi:MAG: hypothetical protein V3T72_05235, partial [Thermoanaerobaculia bacterium]
AILEGRGLKISEVVQEIEALGWDPYSVYGQFLVFARDGLQLAMGGRPDSVDLPLEEAQALARLAETAGYEGLLRLTQLLLDSEDSVRRSEFGMLAVQIAWLRAAELPKVVHIERLLSGTGTAPPHPPPNSARGRGAKTSAAGASQRYVTPDVEPRADGAGPSRVPSFLERLSSKSPSLAALLSGNRGSVRFDGGELLVPQGDRQLAGALKRKHNRDLFEELIRETWGPDAGWKWSAAGAESRSAEPLTATGGEDPFEEARQDPIVQAVLEVFNGSKIQSVRSRPQGETPP